LRGDFALVFASVNGVMVTLHRQLDYGQPPALHRRRRFQRWAIIGAIVAVLITAVAQSPSWLRGIRRAYYERQCKAYIAEVNQIACEVNLATGTLVSPPAGSRNRVPECWRQFGVYGGIRNSASDAILFLHERRAQNGRTRLVELQVDGGLGVGLSASSAIYREDYVSFGDLFVSFRRTHTGVLRVYAGQPDPADASHLTIRYQIDTQSGIIDGWLENDHTVKLQVRDGPLQPH
jgi:hypothetical protein